MTAWLSKLYSFFKTASVTSVVELFPPRSGVRYCPSRMTESTAALILAAGSVYPRWESRSAAERIEAMGLAMFWPSISGAEP